VRRGSGLKRGAPLEDALGVGGPRLEVPVVLLGDAAQHDSVAVRHPARPCRAEGLRREEVLDARVLHDQVLAAHRPQRAVGHQVARPDAGAVDDRGTISRRLGQRVNRPQFDLDSGRLQPSREILEVSGHIHDREGDPEHSAECVRRIAGPHLHPGEELRRRRLAAA
jgi:hypothetical protein